MEKTRFTITEIIVTKSISTLLKIKEGDCISNINKCIKTKGIIITKKNKIYINDDDKKMKLVGVPKFLLSLIKNKYLMITGILIINDDKKNIMIFEDFDVLDNKILF